MLKFLIISDTHGSVKSWEVIERLSGSVNKYYHLGDVLYHGPRNPIPEGYSPSKLAQILKDKNIIYVRGNCDADVDLSVLHNEDMPKFMILTFGHYKAVLLHGENLHSDEDMIELLNAHNADILFYGHTHIPRLEKSSQRFSLILVAHLFQKAIARQLTVLWNFRINYIWVFILSLVIYTWR